ncbi:MAG: hypothetical protein ACFCD0_28860 [Gemmataceae bacterium]
MRWQWLPIGWVVLILAVAGCKNPKPNLKPPNGPAEFNLPPANDRRYSDFPQYSKDALYENPLLRKQKQLDAGRNQMGPIGRPGGGRAGGF